MPFLDNGCKDATLSTDVVCPKEGENNVILRRNQSLDYWRHEDPFRNEGIVTFAEYTGWALVLPPYTFQPYMGFDENDQRNVSNFGDWSIWSSVSGVDYIRFSMSEGVYGQECVVDRDAVTSPAVVRQTVTWSLRSDDTVEFRVYLPSNANSLAVILRSAAGEARYESFQPLSTDWNLFLIEVDQPTSTSGSFDETALTQVDIEVGFSDSVDAQFLIGSAVIDRTAYTSGEVQWQVSLDGGSTWIGWDGTAWTASTWCHYKLIERYLSLIAPSDYSTTMRWMVRCKLIPSNDKKHSPGVTGVLCAIDLDEHYEFENDFKVSLMEGIQLQDITLYDIRNGNGTNQITIKPHITPATVSAVYKNPVTGMQTTTNLFSSQSGTAVTLTETVAASEQLIIHYKVKPPVKIAADRFLIDASIPEIDITLPSFNHSERHSQSIESFVNSSLGKIWSGKSVVYWTGEWELYCVANNSMAVASMITALEMAFTNGLTSLATGFTWSVNDMLPADVGSEHKQGLIVKRLSMSSTGIRWKKDDLQLREERRVRALLPHLRTLPKVGYRK